MPHHNHAHGVSHLATFAHVLAELLPGSWSSQYHPPEQTSSLAELADAVWDMDIVAERLAEHTLDHCAVLTRDDGTRLFVTNRHEQAGYFVAAIAPRDAPAEAYRGVREPDGLTVLDPLLATTSIINDLLPRYDSALAQVRRNAAELAKSAQAAHRSSPDCVVMSWTTEGELTAAPTTETIASVLLANGFAREDGKGNYVLSGDDTAMQAESVRMVGAQLAHQGIDVAVLAPAVRTVPSTAVPPPQWAASRAGARPPAR